MLARLVLVVVLLLLALALAAPARADLSLAKNYNVFTFGNFYQAGADAQGRVAVGGDAKIMNTFGIADRLPGTNPPESRLVVGGNLDWTGSGQVFNTGQNTPTADIRVGGTANVSANVGHNAIHSGNLPFSFAAVEQTLKDRSAFWGNLSANGTATLAYGGLTLKGTDPNFNVFAINGGTELSGLNNLKIDTPDSATVLVNVTGNPGTFTNFGMNLDGTTRSKVLFNFVDATAISMTHFGFMGSVLAPFATLAMTGGNIEGNAIFRQIGTANQASSGEYHILENGVDYSFLGGGMPLPPPGPPPPGPAAAPEPSTFALAGVGLAILLAARARKRRGRGTSPELAESQLHRNSTP